MPSGIPDFRTPGTGLWENVDPMEVAHIDAWRRDPERFWRFYGHRFHVLEDKRAQRAPTRRSSSSSGAGTLDAVVTQNIDRLHRKAGTTRPRRGARDHRDVVVPGLTARATRSPRSGAAWTPTRPAIPRCDCGRPLKPDVVLFGEWLPEAAIDRAFALAADADVLLCVGSSLEVHPVARLPG